MRTDLPDSAWESVQQGHVTGPDSVIYRRGRTRAKRRDCDRYVESGAPIVLYYAGGLQMEWHDGPDAREAWRQVRPAVTVDPQLRGDVEWTAGVWSSDDGRRLVLLTGHC
jgi:hypothetical protein